MASPEDLDPDTDPFRPPETSILVGCLHCRQEYESYLIEWRAESGADGNPSGFWCCPTPGCGGKGFWFDIFPLDPEYEDERGGFVWVDEDDIDESEADDPGLIEDDDGPRPRDPYPDDGEIPY
jgi:hypothetical protein